MNISRNIIYLFSLLSVLLFSCHDNSTEQALNAREQALTEREKQFALKEQDYEALVRMRDSLSSIKKNIDTVTNHWPEAINGLWSSKLLCIASGCNEYAVGDQKTNETWNFTSDSSRMLVTILNNANNALVRVYHAKYDSSGINLHFKTDSLAKRTVHMEVILDQISNGRIKGTQTITIDSTCTAKFSVDLSRNK